MYMEIGMFFNKISWMKIYDFYLTKIALSNQTETLDFIHPH